MFQRGHLWGHLFPYFLGDLKYLTPERLPEGIGRYRNRALHAFWRRKYRVEGKEKLTCREPNRK